MAFAAPHARYRSIRRHCPSAYGLYRVGNKGIGAKRVNPGETQIQAAFFRE
jgi:hypothetical protein